MKFALLFSLFVTAGSSFAGNGESIFMNRIANKISYPTSVNAAEVVTVTVNLHIDAEKRIQIQLVDSGSEAMTQAIVAQIRRLKLPVSNDMIGKDYTFRFILKKQG